VEKKKKKKKKEEKKRKRLAEKSEKRAWVGALSLRSQRTSFYKNNAKRGPSSRCYRKLGRGSRRFIPFGPGRASPSTSREQKGQKKTLSITCGGDVSFVEIIPGWTGVKDERRKGILFRPGCSIISRPRFSCGPGNL